MCSFDVLDLLNSSKVKEKFVLYEKNIKKKKVADNCSEIIC